MTPPAYRPTSPTQVAAIRGMLYALVTAAVGVIIAATPADITTFGPFAPVFVLLARVGEAVLLDRRQPPQDGALGGKGPAR